MKNWPLSFRMAGFAAVVAVVVGAVLPSAAIPAALAGAILYMQYDSRVRRRRAAAASKEPAVQPGRATPSPSRRAAVPPSRRVTAAGSKQVHRRKKR